MWELLQRFTSSSPRVSFRWSLCVLLCDSLLSAVIVLRVPFVNIDWESYTMQVDTVLAGNFNYAEIQGPTGPIAYPCGHVYFYGILRWLDLSIIQSQALFAILYLINLATILQLYRRAGAPGWLLVLCMLSKRVHSIFMLRCFNDGVATLFLYVSIYYLLRSLPSRAAVFYSLSVSIKMHTLSYAPAFGLCLVLQGGWSLALRLVSVMIMVQAVLAIPFIAANPSAYLARAFGGPGDLQKEWSVNWRMLPSSVFYHKYFSLASLACTIILLLWFAQQRWIPYRHGIADMRLWRWSSHARLDARSMMLILFACNFVVIACIRTMHFQFLVWYFHTVPFLAWYAIYPEGYRGFSWAWRCVVVAMLTIAVEIPFLLTTSGQVRGPDGRTWESIGLPTVAGAWLLLGVHLVLLVLLARKDRVEVSDKEG